MRHRATGAADTPHRRSAIARPLSTTPPHEQALLVAVERPGQEWAAADSLEELARLAETVDVEVVGSVTQKLSHPIAGTYFGKGKLEEIKARQDDLAYDVVMVDGDLTPAQQRNLEKALDVKIIDRTALILDVFARRAATHEGRLQVELAQLEYRLPRLTGLWTHLSRQGVGGVGLRGPGETQLESDRRELGKRITQIKRELGEVHRHRTLYRERRKGVPVPVVALVGYTNAGKSTLLNTLTGATVLAEDKLFATLDPTTRRAGLPGGREVLFTDTVGFINNLPTLLIAAFRATLEEINEATVLLHVVDVTHPNAAEQMRTVKNVLEELGADDKPVVTALNKVDLLLPEGATSADVANFPIEDLLARLGSSAELAVNPVPIAGATGGGLAGMMAAIEATLEVEAAFVPVTLTVPYSRTDLVDRFHHVGRVEELSYTEQGTVLTGWLPSVEVPRFAPYVAVRGGMDGESPAAEHGHQDDRRRSGAVA
ncbi:MAG: GTPase HflX [Thermomicrobiales bacterium]